MNNTLLVDVSCVRHAREVFFGRGEAPENLVGMPILRSWERCRRFGLTDENSVPPQASLDRVALNIERERHRCLLLQGRPIMEQIYAQIRESGSMVVLADASGFLLESLGDADFVAQADRVALAPGASWDENFRGTNAIGTALAEEAPVMVHGEEHYLQRNGFLTCCASPIFGPDARLLGVIDISGDYRSAQRHTLALTRMSAALIEKRLFETTHAQGMIVAFHSRADYLGSPQEGLAAVSADGHVLAMNRQGADILQRRHADVVRRDFSAVFDCNLASLVDRQRLNPLEIMGVRAAGTDLHFQLRGQLPRHSVARHVLEASPARPPQAVARSAARPTLDSLASSDPAMQAAINRARRILGRDIPLLIQGESGVGKEIFAKAFHFSGPRGDGPFVALNCASIPETLIESELFGYQGGAFTGARKDGAVGKLQQAHGGTLFLDEIGDMPLNLQARLLRVLQERSITPLGSLRAIDIDISLICATHRRLADEVARGAFREDLYYRLNGLTLTLPALRERSDVRALVHKITAAEAAQRKAPVQFSEASLRALETFSWPGNIRQLLNVIRVAVAMLDDDERLIDMSNLPEEMFTDRPVSAAAPAALPADAAPLRLDELERQAAHRALASAGGNLSEAARKLGVSRNTLYRKLGRM